MGPAQTQVLMDVDNVVGNESVRLTVLVDGMKGRMRL